MRRRSAELEEHPTGTGSAPRPPDDGPVVYVLAQTPGLSQTFVLAELLALVADGVDVRVLALRPSPREEPRQPLASALDGLTRTAPAGPGARRALLGATALALLTRGRGAWSALWWAAAWSLRLRRTNDLARFGHACWLLRGVPPGTRRLHAHFAHGPASAALLLSRLTGVPYSFTAHARDMFELSDTRQLREKVEQAACVVAVSEHGRRHLADVAPRAAERLLLVRNGVDCAALAPPPDVADPADRPFSVITVCRLVPVGSSRVDLQACKLEYSIVSPK